MTLMCPYCGDLCGVGSDTLTNVHWLMDAVVCPGSQQNPRCAQSDARPLWNGKPNPHRATAHSDGYGTPDA